jgi:O-antigen ligase
VERTATVASVVLVLAVAWPVFAFGGVYPWAYAVLAAISVAFAVTAVAAGGWRVDAWLTGAAAVVLVVVLLQLVPLPRDLLATLSPAAAAFLETHNLGYALGTQTGVLLPHALSIDPAATRRFVLFFLIVCLLFAGVKSLGAVRSLRFLVTTITVVGASVALVGLVQAGVSATRMYGIWEPQTATAVFGPFVNRNHFAALMLMSLPIALAQCAAYARAMPRQAGGSAPLVELLGTRAASQTLMCGFAALLMSAALVMTRSRSGMAGFMVVLAAVVATVVARRRSRRALAVAAALAAALAIGVTVWIGWEPLLARFNELPGSRLSGRVDAWSEGARIARAFWPVGSGLNTYASAMLAYHDPDADLYFRTPHNDYLQILTDGGLLAGIPIIVLLGLLAVRIVRALRATASQPSFEAWTRGGAAAGLLAVALQEIVDFSLQTPANAVMVAVLSGYILTEPQPRPRVSGRVRDNAGEIVPAAGAGAW